MNPKRSALALTMAAVAVVGTMTACSNSDKTSSTTAPAAPASTSALRSSGPQAPGHSASPSAIKHTKAELGSMLKPANGGEMAEVPNSEVKTFRVDITNTSDQPTGHFNPETLCTDKDGSTFTSPYSTDMNLDPHETQSFDVSIENRTDEPKVRSCKVVGFNPIDD